MPTTLDVYESRRANLTRLLQEPGAKTQLAMRLGASQSHITHLLKPPGVPSARPIKEEAARQIEQVMGLQPGALDQTSDAVSKQTPRTGDTTKRVERRSEPPVDSSLLEDIVRTVISVAAETHAKLVADKTAAIVRIVYDHAKPTGHVDPAFVVSLVKLMR